MTVSHVLHVDGEKPACTGGKHGLCIVPGFAMKWHWQIRYALEVNVVASCQPPNTLRSRTLFAARTYGRLRRFSCKSFASYLLSWYVAKIKYSLTPTFLKLKLNAQEIELRVGVRYYTVLLLPILISLLPFVLYYCLFMVALCNRADHYIFALWFLSFYLFLFLA